MTNAKLIYIKRLSGCEEAQNARNCASRVLRIFWVLLGYELSYGHSLVQLEARHETSRFFLNLVNGVRNVPIGPDRVSWFSSKPQRSSQCSDMVIVAADSSPMEEKSLHCQQCFGSSFPGKQPKTSGNGIILKNYTLSCSCDSIFVSPRRGNY